MRTLSKDTLRLIRFKEVRDAIDRLLREQLGEIDVTLPTGERITIKEVFAP